MTGRSPLGLAAVPVYGNVAEFASGTEREFTPRRGIGIVFEDDG
jgi:hypothetical protein